MLISRLVYLINHKLAGELLSESFLLVHMDSVIDDINARLNTVFPTFTEVLEENGYAETEYTAIPDKYLRSVVVPGAATKYYEVDEEGNQSAIMFAEEYRASLFYMLRDFSHTIPTEYQAEQQGIIGLSDEDIYGPGMRLNNTWPFDSNTGYW